MKRRRHWTKANWAWLDNTLRLARISEDASHLNEDFEAGRAQAREPPQIIGSTLHHLDDRASNGVERSAESGQTDQNFGEILCKKLNSMASS